MFIDAFRAFFTVDLQPGRCPKFQAAFVHSSFLHQHKSSCCHKSHPDSCLNEEHAHAFGLSPKKTCQPVLTPTLSDTMIHFSMTVASIITRIQRVANQSVRHKAIVLVLLQMTFDSDYGGSPWSMLKFG